MKRIRTRALASAIALLGGAWLGASPLQAQALPATLGAVGGLAAGTYTVVGIYVAEARFGKYLYSLDEALSPRLELLPMVAAPIAGVAMGLSDNERLESAGLWGGVALLAGTAVGIPLGRWAWGSGEGTWAGGIIGGALGLLTGIVAGALVEPDAPALSGAGGPRIPIGITISVP